MGIPRNAAKRDENEAAIVTVLEAAGASVQRLSAKGVPDLLVGYCDYETGLYMNVLMEVKMPKGKLTPDEQQWHDDWKGQVYVVRSTEDALRAIGRFLK